MKKFIYLSIALVMLVSFEGCYSGRYVATPSRTVIIPQQPGPGYVWVEGRWTGPLRRPIGRDGYWSAPGRNRYRY